MVEVKKLPARRGKVFAKYEKINNLLKRLNIKFPVVMVMGKLTKHLPL